MPPKIPLHLAEISRLSGEQFDPHLVPGFVRLVEQLATKHPDLDSHLAAPSVGEARTRIHSLLEGRTRASAAAA